MMLGTIAFLDQWNPILSVTPLEKETNVLLVITVLRAQPPQSHVLQAHLKQDIALTSARLVQLATTVLAALLSQSNVTLAITPLAQ